MPLDREQALYYFWQLLEEVKYLHDNGVVSRARPFYLTVKVLVTIPHHFRSFHQNQVEHTYYPCTSYGEGVVSGRDSRWVNYLRVMCLLHAQKHLSLVPSPFSRGERKGPGIHCLRMRQICT